MRKIKSCKAAGPDGIIGELLRNAGKFDFVLDFLVRIFNVLFDKGTFPANWTESIVFPLCKKGDANNPNTYRGISPCDASSKPSSVIIINTRLQKLVELNTVSLLENFKLGLIKGNYSIECLEQPFVKSQLIVTCSCKVMGLPLRQIPVCCRLNSAAYYYSHSRCVQIGLR